jgi:DNA repair ATPase RecN
MVKLHLELPGLKLEYKGPEKFLEAKLPELLEKARSYQIEPVMRDFQAARYELQRNLDTLQVVKRALAQLEERLNTVGDDAQLANVELQDILQKQQQTLQMMSNISKTVQDTAVAVIRKIGG